MATYRINYGEVREFECQSPSEVVPELQRYHMTGSCDDERLFMRRVASEMCEWNGKNYYFNSREDFADSMIRNGLLEYVD